MDSRRLWMPALATALILVKRDKLLVVPVVFGGG